MPRRAQLAFALVLVLGLALAPLSGVSCGIACMAVTPHPSMPSAAAHQDCVHAAACCHSSGPAICGATHLPQAIAALLTTTAAPYHATAARLRAAESSLPRPVFLAAQRLDRSPPGPAAASPLRI